MGYTEHHYRWQGMEKSYQGTPLIQHTSLCLRSGECLLIIGDNGSGKSTLLKIMSGLAQADKGTFALDDNPPQPLAQTTAQLLRTCLYVHQQPYLFNGSVLYNLKLGLKASKDKTNSQQRLQQAIELADLSALLRTPTHSLSGGEQQRVVIIRSWLSQARVMLLDEPTSNLDEQSRIRVIGMLKVLKQQGIGLAIVTHSLQEFLPIIDRTLTLKNKQLHHL